MVKVKKIRLDQYLTESGMIASVDRALPLVMAGLVSVNGEPATSVAMQVDPTANVTLKETSQFVSRGGIKLDFALESFNISVSGRLCADVGAATGGFSDALLQRGAERVYAVDVGYGDLHWKVRSNPRVVPIERTNARYLEALPEPVGLIAIDASFISLGLLIPSVVQWIKPIADFVLLVKPQFEAKRDDVGDGGIILDREIHHQAVRQVAKCCLEHDLKICGLVSSPILGGQGNKEFLLWVRRDSDSLSSDIETLIGQLT